MPTFPSPPLKLSGRTMAPCGLQIMPRFPSPSLKFRTVSFPQYGFKAGISDVAFPARWFAVALRALCCHRIAPALCQGPMRLQAPPCELLPPLYPRGPRSGPGYVVPVHPRLTDPMRPTPRHIPISPPCDIYEMPSLRAYTHDASAAHEWIRAFVDCSLSACRPQRPREVHRLRAPSSFTHDAGLRHVRKVSALPITPPLRFS